MITKPFVGVLWLLCGRSIGLGGGIGLRHGGSGLGAVATESGNADDRWLRRHPQRLRQGGGDHRRDQQQFQ